jgi:ABC-2 type transport system ATP-binding protein
MLLKVSQVSKSFGSELVLYKVSMSISRGECHCLIGRNGSGKSTLINMIINLIEKDEGTIQVFDSDYENEPELIKKNIGVLPEFNPVIEEFSVQDYLEYIGLIYDLKKELIASRIQFLVEYFFEKEPDARKPISQFSKGMKLKTGLCAALMHKPKLLILDEPFDGLDIFSSNNLVEFLNDYRSKGNAILVSSHDMLFMDKIASHVSVIHGTNLLNIAYAELTQNGKSFEKKVAEIMGYNPKEIREFK